MGTNAPRKCITQRTQRTPTHRRSPFVVLSKVAPRFSPRQVLRQNPTGTQRTQRGREVAGVFLGIGHSSHITRHTADRRSSGLCLFTAKISASELRILQPSI